MITILHRFVSCLELFRRSLRAQCILLMAVGQLLSIGLVALAVATQTTPPTMTTLVLLGVVAMGLGGVVAARFAGRLLRPIQRLEAGVDDIARGDRQHPFAITSRHELGRLAERCEAMRTALQVHLTGLAEEKHQLEQSNRLLKETQVQLIQSEKLAAVGKLAATAAHEVNNPLAIIKTSLHILNKKLAPDDPYREHLGIIEDEAARIARIIKQLLSFARPPTAITLLQINDVLWNLVQLLEEDLAKHDIQLLLDLSPELPAIYVSLDQLKQVLLNLIENAREAMPGGGTLCLRTARQRGGITISVIDDGVGIPAQHLHGLFEPFFSTKQEGEGLGLGLAVSSSIVRSYGGTIDVESKPGKGTTLRIYLPEHMTMIG